MPDFTGRRIDRYEIHEPLGRGGMATVYRATDTRLHRDVAIKIVGTDRIDTEQFPQGMKRFEREIRILAKLSHPNIVPIYDTGDYEGAPYYVMQYMPRGTIQKMIGTPQPWQEVIRAILPVAEGLIHAHRERIIHRDIKPSNILINNTGMLVISDFGISKLLHSPDQTTKHPTDQGNITNPFAGVGTPEYGSPEQWLSPDVDERTDVYGLGVVIYEMLNGYRPYTAESPIAAIYKQMSNPDWEPNGFVAGVPASLGSVIVKAIRSSADMRYPDMESFRQALAGELMRSDRSPAESSSEAITMSGEDVPDTAQDVVPADASMQGSLKKIITDVVLELQYHSNEASLEGVQKASKQANRKLRVFLCHAVTNRHRVRRLHDRLVSDNVDVWMADTKLIPGQTWQQKISFAIKTSDIVVICLSHEFEKRGFRQEELRLALEEARRQPAGQIYVIPARLEDCPVPETLNDRHWVDLFQEAGYPKLMQALQKRAQEVGSIEPIMSPEPFLIEDKEPPAAPDGPSPVNDSKPAPQPIPPRKKSYTWYGLTAIALLLMLLSLGPIVSFTQDWFSTSTPTPSYTQAAISTAEIKLMSRVPGGDFVMGHDAEDSLVNCQKTQTDCELREFANEAPAHTVFVDEFYMDKFEITNRQYRACVSAGACLPPLEMSSSTQTNYYTGSVFDNFPVINVTWDMANAYCSWRGERLPTEAEWEKAARGTAERIYPWGGSLSCDYANTCEGDTVAVGSYWEGVSNYGIYDLAGNVSEWVADWYDPDYYATTLNNATNPKGPLDGTLKAFRGGSWNSDDNDVRSINRRGFSRAIARNYIGFRCVWSP